MKVITPLPGINLGPIKTFYVYFENKETYLVIDYNWYTINNNPVISKYQYNKKDYKIL